MSSSIINTLRYWQDRIGRPEKDYTFVPHLEKIGAYSYEKFICEEYRQQNGPDTFQRVLMCVPRDRKGPLPGVAVPFYYPEAMLGDVPNGQEPLPERYDVTIAMMRHLAERGYVTVSGEASHLTYPRCALSRGDWNRWHLFGEQLKEAHPAWTGIGKLVFDTQTLLDVLSSDPRVDVSCIGIAGHSLGGKMAFYTGCLDPRVKAICASDFGLIWENTNWNDIWYWGSRLDELKADGACHDAFLRATGAKPLAVLAGEADNEASLRLLERAGYTADSPRLCFINHATGHRPPVDVLYQGYDFLDLHLKKQA